MRLISLFLPLLLAACSGDKAADGTDDTGATAPTDADGDGYGGDADCDDASSAVHPGAAELCDGLDNDCSGVVDDDPVDATAFYADADGDGYGDDALVTTACEAPAGTVATGGDCDDADASWHPGAAESDCADPNDYNCDGSVGYADADADGWAACNDCDDASAVVSPDGTEACNDVDDDCDGETDESGAVGETTWYEDGDNDGYGNVERPQQACDAPYHHVADATDCDDTQPTVHPSADESDCTDPVDYNCDGSTGYADADGDGWAACAECDDTVAGVHPDATEACNTVDDDCDGTTDETGATGEATWYADTDGDGYGDPLATLDACGAPAGFVADDTDCDDTDASVNPLSVWWRDADTDGYGGSTYSSVQCAQPAGYVLGSTDCDDYDATIRPGGTEVCDDGLVDEDCDGAIDDADASTDSATLRTWYRDDDADGYGGGLTVRLCASPSVAYIATGGDCADTDPAISPAATEVCDASDTDEDCDGTTDDGDTSATGQYTWYRDADSDTYGDPDVISALCEQPAGHVADATDCDDAVATTNPAGTEVCDAADADEDCDGSTDDADTSVSAATFATFYADTDGDGFGSATSIRQCDLPSGYSTVATDCDDAVAAINPSATEVCDGTTDEDCDGLVDDADTSVSSATFSTWYLDSDGDGYGGTTSRATCAAPTASYIATGGDCNDASASIRPGGTEVCDSADTDEDCDGLADDADSGPTGTSTWYRDADADGYGLVGTTTAACDLPSGYTATSGDCDDASAAISPGDVEICDASNADEDCDGTADDADTSASSATKSTFYLDADADGYGLSTSNVRRCDVPSGYVTSSTDCNDSAVAINPSATEVCDSANTDEDCDSLADDNDSSAATSGKITTYADADGDGYGDAAVASARCDTSAAWVTDYEDCDDTLSGVNPGVTNESCATTYDDDCDTTTNEVNATACVDYYLDPDGDEHGAGTPVCMCDASGPYVATASGDCNESSSTINPSVPEVCDGVDQDCDGTIDDGMTLYYTDADGDGYGDAAEIGSCTTFGGAVTVGQDCDDANDAANPAETEVCDALLTDEDCDGYADDSDTSVTGETGWYVDADLDGYGDDSAAVFYACVEPEGYVDDNTDCDDGEDYINPAADEWYGDSLDEDCDGSTTPTRTYCTPNVGSGRTYASISAAVSAGATSICLASGSYSYSSTLSIPLAGQGMGVSRYSGNIGDNATDVTITGYAYSGGGTLTRVDISSYVRCGISVSWDVYDSIIRGGVTANVPSGTYSCSVEIYNSYITGGTYAFYVYADGDYAYGRSASGSIYCYGCTVESGSTGLYYLYGGGRGTARVNLYNTVYENTGTNYTFESWQSTYVGFNTYNSSSSYSLLDEDYEPPRPTGSLINGGSSSYGETTDFWGVTRSGNPDIGAVEY